MFCFWLLYRLTCYYVLQVKWGENAIKWEMCVFVKRNRNCSTNTAQMGVVSKCMTFFKLQNTDADMTAYFSPHLWQEGLKRSFCLCWTSEMPGCLGQGSQPQKEPGRQIILQEMIIHLCNPHYTVSAVFCVSHCSFMASSHLLCSTFLPFILSTL